MEHKTNARSQGRWASLSFDTLVLIMWYEDFNAEASGIQNFVLESASHLVGSHVTNQRKGKEGISIDPTVTRNNILKYQNSQGTHANSMSSKGLAISASLVLGCPQFIYMYKQYVGTPGDSGYISESKFM